MSTMPIPQSTKDEVVGGNRSLPLKVFYSYADEDINGLEQLELQLSPLREQKIIEEFHRGMVQPGEHEERRVKAYLKQAQIILLLISPHFLDDRHYESTEVQEIIGHYLEPDAAGLPRIIPILLRPSEWYNVPWLARLKPLPDTKKPISLMRNADAEFREIARGIKQVIETLRGREISVPNAELYLYDVALSFAGENCDCAATLADILNKRGLKVFYDQYEKPILWGKDLYTHLSDVYKNKASYCVIFISQHYANKVWTKHELKAAQDRALQEKKEYILPIRLDNTEIPGILSTTAYLSWPPETAETIANAIIEKLGKILKKQQLSTTESQLLTTAWRGVLAFTYLEGKVYEHLLSHLGEVCDREDIKLAIWSDNPPSNSALQKIIDRIRMKIEEDPNNPRYLIAVRGRGYMLLNNPLDRDRPLI